MFRTLLAAAAMSGLMFSTALAQDPAQDPTKGLAQDLRKSGAGMHSSGTSAGSITSQSANQWLGSQLKDAKVIGSNNKRVGEVRDILIDKSGKIDALIVRVLSGRKAKEVALPMANFKVVPAKSGANKSSKDEFRLSMTEKELEQQAAFKAKNQSRATTGARSGKPLPADHRR